MADQAVAVSMYPAAIDKCIYMLPVWCCRVEMRPRFFLLMALTINVGAGARVPLRAQNLRVGARNAMIGHAWIKRTQL